jgi:hypothetical protein
MGFFKDMKDLKKLGDHHGGMPSMKSAMQDLHSVADDRGEGEVLEKGVPAKAICKGFATPVPDDRFAMQIPLEVHPPDGGTPYAVNHVFPTTRMKAAISVGMEIPVKVMPDDPQRIAVQWDAQKASIAAAGGDMAAVTAGLQETYGGVADAAFRAQTAGAPPVPGAPAAPTGDDAATRLNQLGKLREQGLIDDTEYEAKKAEILKDL